jgi:hypothetical protein
VRKCGEIVTLGISGGRSLTGPFRDARRFSSTRLYPVPGATRTTLGFGIRPSSKDHSLSRRAKPQRHDSPLFHRCERGWLVPQPGGAAAARAVVPTVARILHVPFHAAADGAAAAAAAELRALQELLLAEGAVTHLVKGLEALDPEALLAPMSLLSRLVLGSPAFARQLLDAGALLPRTAALLLAPTNPPPVLVDALLTVSQLARITRDHYAPLAAANCYSALRALLGHWDPGVRARACNLVGNMCRHGADFYPALLQHGLLQVRIRISTDTVAGHQPWPAVSERGWLRGRASARDNARWCWVPTLRCFHEAD